MREILFRGKNELDSPWIFGDLIREDEIINHFPADPFEKPYNYINSSYFIRDKFSGAFNRVRLNTIGEFTGLIDYHGNKVFEGDIVRTSNKSLQGIIVYNINTCSYVIANKEIIDDSTMYEDIEPFADDLEVIGNFVDGVFMMEVEE